MWRNIVENGKLLQIAVDCGNLVVGLQLLSRQKQVNVCKVLRRCPITTSVLQNSYLSISNYRPAPHRASRISLIYFQYLVRLSLYIRMSLIYTVQKISRQGCRVLFTKCQNKLRAFARPNSITKYLNSLYQVRNTVSYLSPSIIRRRLNI